MQPWIKKTSSACSAPPFWWAGLTPARAATTIAMAHGCRIHDRNARQGDRTIGPKLDLDDAQKNKSWVCWPTSCRHSVPLWWAARPTRAAMQALVAGVPGLTAPGPSRC